MIKKLPTVPQEVGIPERTKKFLSHEVYFTLDEAVEFAISKHPECTASHLLHFGYLGKLDFITPLPVGVELNPKYGEREGPFPPNPVHAPKFLIIDRHDCHQIDSSGIVEQNRFENAHAIYCDVQKFFPSFVDSSGKNVVGSWQTFFLGNPHNIPLTRNRLFVLRSEVISLIKNEVGSWKTAKEERDELKRTIDAKHSGIENANNSHIQREKIIGVDSFQASSGKLRGQHNEGNTTKAVSTLPKDKTVESNTKPEAVPFATPTPATMNNASIDVQTTSRGNAEDDLDTAVNALKSKPQEFAALVIQPKHNHAKETKEVRVARLRLRKAVLIQQGVKNFLEVLSEEEGYKGTSRIKQLLAPPDNQPKKQSSKSVKKTNDWDY